MNENSVFNKIDIYIDSFSAPEDIILRPLARLKGFKGKIRDLSSSLINIERQKDPVGEKSTKIGSHKGGRPLGRRSYFGGLSLRQGLFLPRN